MLKFRPPGSVKNRILKTVTTPFILQTKKGQCIIRFMNQIKNLKKLKLEYNFLQDFFLFTEPGFILKTYWITDCPVMRSFPPKSCAEDILFWCCVSASSTPGWAAWSAPSLPLLAGQRPQVLQFYLITWETYKYPIPMITPSTYDLTAIRLIKIHCGTRELFIGFRENINMSCLAVGTSLVWYYLFFCSAIIWQCHILYKIF